MKLNWKIDPHFLAYVSGLPDGSIDVQQPAEHTNGYYIFPEATIQPGRMQFSGAIHFSGHGGLLDVLFQDPAFETTEDGSVLRVTGSEERVPFLNLKDIGKTPGTTYAATLRGEAIHWFAGVYAPGRPFGQVTIQNPRE